MKQVVHDIALEVGGSHYPNVGGRLLEQSIDMVAKKCVELAQANGHTATADSIAQHFQIDQ